MKMTVKNRIENKSFYYTKRLKIIINNKLKDFTYKNINIYSNNNLIFFTISNDCPISKSPILYYIVENLNSKIFEIGNKELYVKIKDFTKAELESYIKNMINLAIIETEFNLKKIFKNAIIQV